MKSNLFFEKIMDNSLLVENLKKLNISYWKNINNSEKLRIFENIGKELQELYSDFCKCTFNFAFMSENAGGVTCLKNININATLIYEERFLVLSSMIHELRHIYQEEAVSIYLKYGVCHELFDEKELKDIVVNSKKSALGKVDNYIYYSQYTDNEYKRQPIEFDAEMFSLLFMKFYQEAFAESEEDVKACKKATKGFERFVKQVTLRDNDIFNFNNIYWLHYLEYVKDNEDRFSIENKIRDNYFSVLKNKDSLDVQKLYYLCAPCFWEIYDIELKRDLLNVFLAKFGLNDRIYTVLDKMYINEKDISEDDCRDAIEVILNVIANRKIEKIISKDSNLNETEKIIKLHFDHDRINKEDNPLLYNLQPDIIYKNKFIYDNFVKLFECFDKVYEGKYNFFNENVEYLKKYDVEAMIRKAGIFNREKNYSEFYDTMIEGESFKKNNLKR